MTRLLFIAMLMLVTSAYATGVTLHWDASPSNNVDGYNVYARRPARGNAYQIFGTASSSQHNIAFNGISSTHSYVFVATAFDSFSGGEILESVYSNECPIPQMGNGSRPRGNRHRGMKAH